MAAFEGAVTLTELENMPITKIIELQNQAKRIHNARNRKVR
jgi:hypothetical protein